MMDAKIIGLPELKDKLTKLPTKVQKENLVSALLKGAEPIRAAAAAKAPRGKTKRLAANIVKEKVSSKKFESSVGVGPAKSVYYGIFQEYGFKKRGGKGRVPAQPFLRPAFDTRNSDASSLIGQELKRLIESLAK